jgi:hypothetical protein
MGPAWTAVVVSQWIVIALLCLVCIGILRYLAVFRERMELAAPPTTALSIGERVPELEFQRVDTGEALRFPRGRACLLAFVTSNCGSCSALLTQVDEIIRRGRSNSQSELVIVVMDKDITTFMTAWNRISAAASANVYAVRDVGNSAHAMLGLWALPTAVLLDARGRITDQTTNPHITGWLFRSLKEERPVETTKTPSVASVSMPTWMDVDSRL